MFNALFNGGWFLFDDEVPRSPTPTPFHDVFRDYPMNTTFGHGSEKYLILGIIVIILCTAGTLAVIHFIRKLNEGKNGND